MSFDLRFDIRHILTASVISAAMAMPVLAQDAATSSEPANDAATSSEAATAPEAGAESTAEATSTEAPASEFAEDLYLGDESAPLTIYEYASFTCPHCASFHQDVFPTLKSEYIDTGKVRFVQRDVYFDQVGLWAGILARCDESKFYPIAGMLLDEQSDWLGAESGEELVGNLRKYGAKVGLTTEQMDACWNDAARVEQLVATYQKNATEDDISGTPTFMIGGEQVPNQAWEDMKEIIDVKLAEVEGDDTAAAN